MFTIRRPTDADLEHWLATQQQRKFTYPSVGVTSTSPHVEPPTGFRCDHTRAKIGSGMACFEAAKSALADWKQFQLGWLQARPANTPLEVGAVVAVVAHSLGLWSSNAARVVYVVDSPGPPARFGFAYGTLPGHIARGEERFLVEWHEQDDSVWFDILAYSRPRNPLGWLGYPWMRRMQKLFGRDSVAAMRRAVAEHRTGLTGSLNPRPSQIP